ncbi:MAG TPA: MGMT family protein [Candidatus Thermoplasmatota archaeon]|nr:MGMT family protein [Candidatus Thermoplasmatota archaeon]
MTRRRARFDPDVPFPVAVWNAVRAIPPGRVLSYGDVGLLAGRARAARAVAAALRFTGSTDVPWHRVVGAGGEVRIRDPSLRAEQIRRLRREGVPVDARGRFRYAEYAWRP